MRSPPCAIDNFVAYELTPQTAIALPENSFVIETCQRKEVYSYGSRRLPFQSSFTGWECFERLVYLCCGGDSRLLGETEIFGQIKEAYRVQGHALSPKLHWLIQSAFWAAKDLRTRLPLASGPSSYGGWTRRQLLSHPHFHDNSTTILFVGAGHLIHELAHFIAPRVNPSRLRWMNRTQEKCQVLETRYGGQTVAFSPEKITDHAFQLIAVHELPSPNAWGAAWENWSTQWSTRGAVIDLSSPTQLPTSLISEAHVSTLENLRSSSDKECALRLERQKQLNEQIMVWRERHFTPDFEHLAHRPIAL